MKRIPTTIGIIGTCVSADLFEYYNDPKRTLISKTAMRDVTVFAPLIRPSRIIPPIRHASSLHTMWLQTVYDGNVFNYLQENAGEYLLIDLVDERFDLFTFQGAVFIRHFFEESNFFNYVDKNECRFFSHEELDDKTVRSLLQDFCKELLKVYEPSKIIINKFLLADEYVEYGTVKAFDRENDLRIIKKSKKFFSKWYGILEEMLPGARTISFKKTYYASATHPRGISPCHNTMDYYEDTYKSICRIIENDYWKQRQLPVSMLSLNKNKSTVHRYLSVGVDDYCAKIMAMINDIIDIKGKKVLWISRRKLQQRAIRRMGIDKFAQIYIYRSEEEKIAFLEDHENADKVDDNKTPIKDVFRNRNFMFFYEDSLKMSESFCDYFDIIFYDEIEYEKEIDIALDNIYKCLSKNGAFIAKTGRTWSANEGSKWKVDNALSCSNNEGVIPPYPHLFKNYSAVENAVKKSRNITNETAHQIALKIIKGEPGLNQMMYEDYKLALSGSLFHEKQMCPLYKEPIADSIKSGLERLFRGYTHFDFKSLVIACRK